MQLVSIIKNPFHFVSLRVENDKIIHYIIQQLEYGFTVWHSRITKRRKINII